LEKVGVGNFTSDSATLRASLVYWCPCAHDCDVKARWSKIPGYLLPYENPCLWRH